MDLAVYSVHPEIARAPRCPRARSRTRRSSTSSFARSSRGAGFSSAPRRRASPTRTSPSRCSDGRSSSAATASASARSRTSARTPGTRSPRRRVAGPCSRARSMAAHSTARGVASRRRASRRRPSRAFRATRTTSAPSRRRVGPVRLRGARRAASPFDEWLAPVRASLGALRLDALVRKPHPDEERVVPGTGSCTRGTTWTRSTSRTSTTRRTGSPMPSTSRAIARNSTRARAPVGLRARPRGRLRARPRRAALPRPRAPREARLRALVAPRAERDAQLLSVGPLGEHYEPVPASPTGRASAGSTSRSTRRSTRAARSAGSSEGGRRGRGRARAGPPRRGERLRDARPLRARRRGRPSLVPPPRRARGRRSVSDPVASAYDEWSARYDRTTTRRATSMLAPCARSRPRSSRVTCSRWAAAPAPGSFENASRSQALDLSEGLRSRVPPTATPASARGQTRPLRAPDRHAAGPGGDARASTR